MNDATELSSTALSSLETAELHLQLDAAIGLTARSISRVAAIWVELERRGEDMSRHRFSLRSHMRAVADGHLMPEAVAALAGQPRTLQLVADLPVRDQRRLIEGETITVLDGNGAPVDRTLANMTFGEAARVIRNGRILTAEEQRMALDRVRKQPRLTPRTGRPPRIVVANGLVQIGATSPVPIERVLAVLREAGYYLTATEAAE
jgi:hypothetical protein